MLKIVRRIEDVLKLLPNVKPNHSRCLVRDISDPDKKEFQLILSDQEIELIEMLSRIQDSANIYPPLMNELWDKIQKYANMKVQIEQKYQDESK